MIVNSALASLVTGLIGNNSRSSIYARTILIFLSILLGGVIGFVAIVASGLELIGLIVMTSVLALSLVSSAALTTCIFALIFLLPFAVIPAVFPVQPSILQIALTLLIVRVGLIGATRISAVWPGRFTMMTGMLLVVWLAAVIYGTGRGIDVDGIQHGSKLAIGISMFFCGHVVARNRHLEINQKVIVVAGGVQAFLALWIWQAGIEAASVFESLHSIGYPAANESFRYLPDETTLRSIGTLIDPNILGACLATALIIGCGLAFRGYPAIKYGWVAIVGLIALALLTTLSRGSWLAVVVVLIYLVSMSRPRLGLVLTGVGILSIFAVPVGPLMHLKSGLMLGDIAASMRLDEYAEATKVIKNAPWIGFGFPKHEPAAFFLGVSNASLWISERAGLLAGVLYTGLTIGVPVYGLIRCREARIMASAALCLSITGIVDHHIASIPHMLAFHFLLLGSISFVCRESQFASRD